MLQRNVNVPHCQGLYRVLHFLLLVKPKLQHHTGDATPSNLLERQRLSQSCNRLDQVSSVFFILEIQELRMKIRTLFKCLQIFMSSYSLPRPLKSPDLPATSFPRAAALFLCCGELIFVQQLHYASRNLSVSKTMIVHSNVHSKRRLHDWAEPTIIITQEGSEMFLLWFSVQMTYPRSTLQVKLPATQNCNPYAMSPACRVQRL